MMVIMMVIMMVMIMVVIMVVIMVMVARPRFELGSEGPKPSMLDLTTLPG